MEYIKKCKKCGESQIYKTKSNYNRAIKNDTLCKSCNNKIVSNETRNKISNKLSGKKKSKESVIKMKESLTEFWKNKTDEEMNEWKQTVSKSSSKRWKSDDYRKRVSDSVKSHWDSLTDDERISRYISQQDGGAGRCKYMEVNEYLVYGNTEKRYILNLVNTNSKLPLNKDRVGIKTPYGICFPDFDFGESFTEIKSLYTFNKMLDEYDKKDNCQLNKLLWINNNIKKVNIVVETSRNKFVDKTELAILPFIKKEKLWTDD